MDFFSLLLLLLSGTQLLEHGSCNDDLLPVIKEHPKSLITRRQSPATLNCAASGATRFEWFKDGEKLLIDNDEDSRKSLLIGGALFFLRVISNKRESDSGTYYCVAYNRFGHVKSNNATLTIASLGDNFMEEPEPVVKMRQGQYMKMPCRPPKGVPLPEVIWKHDGSTVTNNSRVYTTADGDLVFEDVTDRDSGTYVCVAENSAGTRESRSSSVTIMSLPWFEERPQNLSAIAGATVEFHCRAKGSPTPNVTWRRLDGKMPLERTLYIEGKTLRISDVIVSDSGIYICEAKNEAGNTMTLGSLKVVAAPTVREKPNDALLQTGKELKLRCRVEGDPKPLVVWKLPFHDRNSLLLGGQRNERASVSNDSNSLKVTKLRIDDTGVYQCWGISTGGGILSSANVVVVEALPPPLIGVRPQDQEVKPKSSVTLPCEVVSEAAEPTVTWWYQEAAHLKAQQLLPKVNVDILATGALILKQVTAADGGIYTCRVSSPAGNTEAEAILKVMDDAPRFIAKHPPVPAPPSKPRIVSYNETSVHLTWLPNSRVSAGNAESYLVEYWRAPWPEWRVARAEIKDTSCIIRDLLHNTAYIFLVRAVNSNGESFPSPWTDMIYTLTPPNVGVSLEEGRQIKRKLNKPTVTLDSARASGPDTVTLSWEISNASEIDVDGVIVYSVGEKTIKSATVLGMASSSHIVRDLRPNTRYTFFLVPFWRTFEGLPSNAQAIVTPEQAPEIAPTGLTAEIFDSGIALVRWQPLTTTEARGAIIGYRVSLSHNNLTTEEETQNSWLEAQRLTEGRFYTVKVAGVSGGGVGPWSSPMLLDLSRISSPVIPPDTANEKAGEVPSVLYAPPHPVWLLYLLVPLLIVAIIVMSLLYLRRVRKKSEASTLEVSSGPAFYSTSGMYEPGFRSVNMYGEQKSWRPSDSDQDSSLSSAKLLRPELLANEYAEPRIQRIPDPAEPYATTALLAPSSPRMYRLPASSWRHGKCQEENIQVNWMDIIPPPPSCPPPSNFPHQGPEVDTCSSATTSDSGDRRLYNTGGGSSSQYENAGGSEQYERPCDVGQQFDAASSEHVYAAYSPTTCREPIPYSDHFQTFNSLQGKPVRKIMVDLHPIRIELPKSNTH